MCSKKRISIRSSLVYRLTLWYAGIFSLFFFLAFVVFYIAMTSAFLRTADNQLISEVTEFVSTLAVYGLASMKTTVRLESESEGIDRTFYRIFSPQGEVIAESDMRSWSQTDIKPHLASQVVISGKPVFDTLVYDKFPYKARVVYASIGPEVIIQLGESMDEEAEFVRMVNYIFGLSTFVIICCSAIIGWFMANRAMEGVKDVSRTARDIAAGALDKRVRVRHRGDEIDELACAFNHMADKTEKLITEMREMTDNIAHDLKSPVTGIRGHAEVTLNSGKTPDDFRKMAANTIEECDKMLGMINTMLYISETTSGVGGQVHASVNLCAVIGEAVDLFEPVAEDHHISMTMDIPARCEINGDRQMLQRMVGNILDNALKFSGQGGTVHISLAREPHVFVLQFSDTGPGIPEAELPYIFKRYYRCDKSRSLPGSGLGLSLVQAIVHAHAGTVSVQNRDQGGCLVTVTLPCQIETEASS